MRSLFWTAWIVFAAAFLGGRLCTAQQAVEPATQKIVATLKPAAELPADLIDEAFVGKVDLAAIRDAIGALDAGALISHAEKLLLAERAIGRKHKSLDFAELLGLAIRIAVEDRDQKTFDAIVETLSRLKVKDLEETVAAARQRLLERPRKISAGPNVPLSETTSDAIVLYNALMKQVRMAKMVGDRQALASMRQKIQMTPELHVKQRQHLVLLCDDAIASLTGDSHPASVTLSKLSASLYKP